jgi:transcriptional regulator with XRE-family HTH domain
MAFIKERLIALRNEAGLTQDDLAARTGVALRSIQRYEMGDNKPNNESITKIAKELGVSTSYLMGETSSRSSAVTENDLTEEERELIYALRAKQFKKAFQSFTVLAADSE